MILVTILNSSHSTRAIDHEPRTLGEVRTRINLYAKSKNYMKICVSFYEGLSLCSFVSYGEYSRSGERQWEVQSDLYIKWRQTTDNVCHWTIWCCGEHSGKGSVEWVGNDTFSAEVIRTNGTHGDVYGCMASNGVSNASHSFSLKGLSVLSVSG